jgi:hypothetical protein
MVTLSEVVDQVALALTVDYCRSHRSKPKLLLGFDRCVEMTSQNVKFPIGGE